MSYKVFYDHEKHIVYNILKGRQSTPETVEAAQLAIKIAREHDCKRHLCDVREGMTRESLGRLFMFMDGLEALGLDRGDRIAIVYGQDAEKHEFAQVVARNRGWHNLRYLQSLEEAETWLLEDG